MEQKSDNNRQQPRLRRSPMGVRANPITEPQHQPVLATAARQLATIAIRRVMSGGGP